VLSRTFLFIGSDARIRVLPVSAASEPKTFSNVSRSRAEFLDQ
jgi:hypothetical protein